MTLRFLLLSSLLTACRSPKCLGLEYRRPVSARPCRVSFSFSKFPWILVHWSRWILRNRAWGYSSTRLHTNGYLPRWTFPSLQTCYSQNLPHKSSYLATQTCLIFYFPLKSTLESMRHQAKILHQFHLPDRLPTLPYKWLLHSDETRHTRKHCSSSMNRNSSPYLDEHTSLFCETDSCICFRCSMPLMRSKVTPVLPR